MNMTQNGNVRLYKMTEREKDQNMRILEAKETKIHAMKQQMTSSKRNLLRMKIMIDTIEVMIVAIIQLKKAKNIKRKSRNMIANLLSLLQGIIRKKERKK